MPVLNHRGLKLYPNLIHKIRFPGRTCGILRWRTRCFPSFEVKNSSDMSPLHYKCWRAIEKPRMDGIVSGVAWDAAEWTDEFQDILGGRGVKPYLSTRCKLLYDDDYFYVGAYLEEPHVWGSLTERNSVVFHDNDFEVFLDPDGDGLNYYEFEVNALGTIWELSLDKPYKNGGSARSGHNLAELEYCVHVDGTLNDASTAPDKGWSVTVAFPLGVNGLGQFGAQSRILAGAVWRVNFARVQWEHKIVDGAYERVPPLGTPLPQGSNQWHPEKNWVWSAQEEVNMHAPDTWGYVEFCG